MHLEYGLQSSAGTLGFGVPPTRTAGSLQNAPQIWGGVPQTAVLTSTAVFPTDSPLAGRSVCSPTPSGGRNHGAGGGGRGPWKTRRNPSAAGHLCWAEGFPEVWPAFTLAGRGPDAMGVLRRQRAGWGPRAAGGA